MRWFEQQRQSFIADFVRGKGTLNVKDVMDKFGISKPQASRDIQKFIKEYPNLLTYNTSTKRYEIRKPESAVRGK